MVVPGDIEIDDPEFVIPPADIYFSGHDFDDYWFGVPGRFHIEFTIDRTTDSTPMVSAQVSGSIPCHQLQALPDVRRNIVSSNVNSYEPLEDIAFLVDYSVDISSDTSDEAS